jgi:dipeptidyl aminopeptidase/acylaminoacyl peptidase
MKRVSLLLLVACTSAQPAPPAAEEEVEKTFGGSRPVTVRVPDGYDAKKPAPLVIMLHGYGSAGRLTDIYWKMSSIADKHGFFYVAPDGLQDKTGKRFWNANPNRCDYEKTGVDDALSRTPSARLHAVRFASFADPREHEICSIKSSRSSASVRLGRTSTLARHDDPAPVRDLSLLRQGSSRPLRQADPLRDS